MDMFTLVLFTVHTNNVVSKCGTIAVGEGRRRTNLRKRSGQM